MPIATGREILDAARAGGYAVGAFNCHTLGMITAVVGAASAEKSPVILQFTEGSIKTNGWEALSAVAHVAAVGAGVPVAIHLDHGASFALAIQAIRHGFTSVMIDGSQLPYAENVALTRQVVAAAHAAGVSVEAEIGHVGGVADEQGSVHGWLTEPADAERFWRDAGMDYLATAFGTAHGFYKETPRLDLSRIAEIARRVDLPLVMHGGSGVPEDQMRVAIACGIAKVNVATELKDAWARALRTYLTAQPGEMDPRRILGPAHAAVAAVAREDAAPRLCRTCMSRPGGRRGSAYRRGLRPCSHCSGTLRPRRRKSAGNRHTRLRWHFTACWALRRTTRGWPARLRRFTPITCAFSCTAAGVARSAEDVRAASAHRGRRRAPGGGGGECPHERPCAGGLPTTPGGLDTGQY